jgi:hypothetical protein
MRRAVYVARTSNSCQRYWAERGEQCDVDGDQRCVRDLRETEAHMGVVSERPRNEGSVLVSTRNIAIIALVIAVIVLLLLLL